jgi:hypothetical protein
VRVLQILTDITTNVYTLKEDKDTGELHLFEGKMTKENRCNSSKNSICQKMQKSETDSTKFACKDEDKARIACAKIGRKVCGVCVSRLYTTYEQK